MAAFFQSLHKTLAANIVLEIIVLRIIVLQIIILVG